MKKLDSTLLLALCLLAATASEEIASAIPMNTAKIQRRPSGPKDWSGSHQPSAQPAANTTSTTMTIGACHSTPKNQRTLACCWLFSANAKSVKKRRALKSQTRIRIRARF